MTDVTVTTIEPQSQPGGVRDSSGTIQDTPSTTTPTPEIQSEPKTTTSTDPAGTTFLTGQKTEEPKVEPKTEPKTEVTTGAPEKYTDFKAPEGFKFSDEGLAEATAIFKELNLSQEGAQKLVDTYTKQLTESARAPYDLWANTQREWNTEILSRFGGESGADKLRGDINGVINRVLPPSLQKSFRAALDFTGAGSNPDMLEAFSIMLRPHMEGRPVTSGNPSPGANPDPTRTSGPIDPAAAMYPHLVKNRPQ